MRISECSCETILLTVSMLSLGSLSPLSTLSLETLRLKSGHTSNIQRNNSTSSYISSTSSQHGPSVGIDVEKIDTASSFTPSTKEQNGHGANVYTSRSTSFTPYDKVSSYYTMLTTGVMLEETSTIGTTSSVNILSTSPPSNNVLTTDLLVNVPDYVLASTASTVSTTKKAPDSKDRQLKPPQIPFHLNSNIHRQHSAISSNRNNTSREYKKTTTALYISSSGPATISTHNADEVVFLNRNKATTRTSTPSTTIRSPLLNGLSGTSTSTTSIILTNLSSVNQSNVNTTTPQNEIDFKEVFTAPVFKCPDDHRRDMEGNCKKNYEGHTEKRT